MLGRGLHGECSAENSSHGVYITLTFDPDFADAVRDSMAQDYNLTGQFNMYNSSGINISDVYWVHATFDSSIPQKFWLYETCRSSSTHGGGNGYYGWCRPHAIRVDKSRPGWQDVTLAKMDYLACHELGHSVGLQHPGTYPNENAPRVTCMDYQQDKNLGNHDREHLIDCFPIPTPWQSSRTPRCRDTTGL